jgi:hypothetical protein
MVGAWKRENTMALDIVIIHVLAGAAVGMRFKVMILVPAVTLTMLFAAIIGVTRGDKFWSIAVSMILLGTAIQVGYLAATAPIPGCRRKVSWRPDWVAGQRRSRPIDRR